MSDTYISSITATDIETVIDPANDQFNILGGTGYFNNMGTVSTGINTLPPTGTITISDWITENSGPLTIGGSSLYRHSSLNPYTNHGGLKVEGPTEINGPLTLNGVDIGETLELINQRLAILKPNPELESRWERLKALGEEYRALEKDILEQEKVYEILKK